MKILEERIAKGECQRCGAVMEISAGDIKGPMGLFDSRAYVVCGCCKRKLPISDEDLAEYFGLYRT